MNQFILTGLMLVNWLLICYSIISIQFKLYIICISIFVGKEEIPDYKPDKIAVASSNIVFFVVLFIFAVFET